MTSSGLAITRSRGVGFLSLAWCILLAIFSENLCAQLEGRIVLPPDLAQNVPITNVGIWLLRSDEKGVMIFVKFKRNPQLVEVAYRIFDHRGRMIGEGRTKERITEAFRNEGSVLVSDYKFRVAKNDELAIVISREDFLVDFVPLDNLDMVKFGIPD